LSINIAYTLSVILFTRNGGRRVEEIKREDQKVIKVEASKVALLVRLVSPSSLHTFVITSEKEPSQRKASDARPKNVSEVAQLKT